MAELEEGEVIIETTPIQESNSDTSLAKAQKKKSKKKLDRDGILHKKDDLVDYGAEPSKKIKGQSHQQQQHQSGNKSKDQKKNKAEHHSTTYKTKPCEFYKKGACQRGDLCTFSHDFPVEKLDTICKFFLAGTCTKGDACPFSHDIKKYPCKYLNGLGFCDAGINCRFSHDKIINEEKLTEFMEDNFEFLSEIQKKYGRTNLGNIFTEYYNNHKNNADGQNANISLIPSTLMNNENSRNLQQNYKVLPNAGPNSVMYNQGIMAQNTQIPGQPVIPQRIYAQGYEMLSQPIPIARGSPGGQILTQQPGMIQTPTGLIAVSNRNLLQGSQMQANQRSGPYSGQMLITPPSNPIMNYQRPNAHPQPDYSPNMNNLQNYTGQGSSQISPPVHSSQIQHPINPNLPMQGSMRAQPPSQQIIVTKIPSAPPQMPNKMVYQSNMNNMIQGTTISKLQGPQMQLIPQQYIFVPQAPSNPQSVQDNIRKPPVQESLKHSVMMSPNQSTNIPQMNILKQNFHGNTLIKQKQLGNMHEDSLTQQNSRVNLPVTIGQNPNLPALNLQKHLPHEPIGSKMQEEKPEVPKIESKEENNESNKKPTNISSSIGIREQKRPDNATNLILDIYGSSKVRFNQKVNEEKRDENKKVKNIISKVETPPNALKTNKQADGNQERTIALENILGSPKLNMNRPNIGKQLNKGLTKKKKDKEKKNIEKLEKVEGAKVKPLIKSDEPVLDEFSMFEPLTDEEEGLNEIEQLPKENFNDMDLETLFRINDGITENETSNEAGSIHEKIALIFPCHIKSPQNQLGDLETQNKVHDLLKEIKKILASQL